MLCPVAPLNCPSVPSHSSSMPLLESDICCEASLSLSWPVAAAPAVLPNAMLGALNGILCFALGAHPVGTAKVASSPYRSSGPIMALGAALHTGLALPGQSNLFLWLPIPEPCIPVSLTSALAIEGIPWAPCVPVCPIRAPRSAMGISS